MAAEVDTTKVNVQTISLQMKESADLELVKAKGIIKKNLSDGSSSLGWLAHLSKVLEVFEAIDQSNQMMDKEHKALDKANFLKQILYNAVSNCSSLDQLKEYFKNYKNSDGPFSAQDPSFGNLISQLGEIIQSAENGYNGDKSKPSYVSWQNEECDVFKNVIKQFDLSGAAATKADAASQKDSEGEQKALVSAMNTLGTMSVQSLTDPGASSGFSSNG